MMGGWLKRIILADISGPKKDFRNLPINKRCELLINTSYPEISNVWNSQKINKKEKAKTIQPIIINIALHEAVREVMLNWWQDSSIDFDIAEIKKGKDIFDEMWADFIRGVY